MKTIKTVLISLLAYIAISKPASHELMTSPLIAHCDMLRELKVRFREIVNTLPLKAVQQPSLTQTEAYYKKYRSDIKRVFEGNLKAHKTIIRTIIDKEKEFADSHAVFYHAHDRNFIILQDFMKLLDEYLRIVTVNNDFVPLRLKDVHGMAEYNNVRDYLKAHPYINDHDEETRRHMICVNLSLFGNHDLGGECTFDYFLSNRSVASAGLSARLEPIFSHYGLNEKYIAELADLIPYLESSTGNLLQIFIPHDIVNNLLYLSEPLGSPRKHVTLDGRELSCKKNSMQSLIQYMRIHPDRIPDLNEWQARLMFFDPLLDMHPQIKVLRYNTISDQNMQKYQEKLKEIVVQVVIDYLKTTTVQYHTPLFRLHKYMLLHNDKGVLKYIQHVL